MNNSLAARIRFLILIARIPPEAWDWIFPHGPAFKSIAAKEQLMAGVLRDIATHITDKDAAAKTKMAGSELIKFAATGLVRGWEEGDDYCPPYPFPFPFPDTDPRTFSPRMVASALNVIAKATTLPKIGAQIGEIAARLGAVTKP